MTTKFDISTVLSLFSTAFLSVEDAAWKNDGTLEDSDCLVSEDAIDCLERLELLLRQLSHSGSADAWIRESWHLLAPALRNQVTDAEMLGTLRAIDSLLSVHTKAAAGT